MPADNGFQWPAATDGPVEIYKWELEAGGQKLSGFSGSELHFRAYGCTADLRCGAPSPDYVIKVVPEPSAAVLLVSALVGLVVLHRWRTWRRSSRS